MYYNCVVAHKHCPFDYCNTFMVSFHVIKESDLQCEIIRDQVFFVNSAKKDLVMYWLGSNSCMICTNQLLVAFFTFAGFSISLLVFK